ncbi:DUF3592 domain-containing protein [Amycolatopsis sp. cg5]|uniref:DUF3592 domain-containing protein n=1 Tax=Amycolatopsis sp. cg5 TaxID=3238802 RepID=UPI0035260978
MELGEFTGNGPRPRGRRGLWITVGVVAALVFVVFVAGTTWSLLAPSYVLDDGELAADFGVLAVSVSIWVLSVRRLRVAKHPDDVAIDRWQPASKTRVVDGSGHDLDAHTRRLRLIGLRAYGLMVLWFGVFVGGIVGLSVLDSAAETLLANGTRVPGQVVGVHNPTKGSPSIDVSYYVGQVWHCAEIDRDTDLTYYQSQTVTVIYEPADPDHVRTLEEKNTSGVLTGFCVVPMLLALIFMPCSVFAGVAWRRRYRAVLKTGWRSARVTVVPDYPIRKNRNSPDLHVSYDDGTNARLRAVLSTHGSTKLRHEPDRKAWVGGTGRTMVVLFERGRWRNVPYAVPAKALGLTDHRFLG